MTNNSPFLSLVAKDLLDRFGTNLADVTVVFPGQRARLFFTNYLYEHAQAPLRAPRYLSIDDLFEQASSLRKADSILLICELYKAYTEVYNSHASQPTPETLDEFFFFGEILLNDFDDIDKHLVNARSLFCNLQDLDALRDDFSHLSEEQIETLRRYFKHSFQGDSSLKTAFWSIWNLLGEVYATFRERLAVKQAAYPGMLLRSVIEDEEAVFPGKQYVFAGFNVLNTCEERLFKRLKDRSLFYWDYDKYYLKNEAGRFIESNIQKFGSALDASLFDCFNEKEKEITFIASSSESGQSAVIPSWIASLNQPASFEDPDSAIVLCNESILPVVMHSIPPLQVENVNITMGFPINLTPINSFLQVVAEMQTKGYTSSFRTFRHKAVLAVLRHPYTRIIFPEAQKVELEITKNNIFFPSRELLADSDLFGYASDAKKLANSLLNLIQRIGQAMEKDTSDTYKGLYQESVFRAYQIVNRLYGLLSSGELDVERTTFLRLMKKLMSTTQIPFHGEPVKGLQVMGVLETRLIDFKHLLLLSTNEGFMPGTNNDNTFIPQFLRKHFELSTVERQDSVFAYYFYRLIQRTEKLTIVYNTDSTQTGKAEMSRFLLQLLIDKNLTIKRYSLQSAVKPLQSEPIVIEKTDDLMRRILNKYDLNRNPQAKALSPSAINTFIDCSFRFYLQYIEELRSKDELSEEMDSSVFGTIFHRAAEYLYRAIGKLAEDNKSFAPFVVHPEDFDAYLEFPHLVEKLVSRAFNKEYFKNDQRDLSGYNGEQLINHRVVCHLLRRLIEFDRQQAPFFVHGLEYPVYESFDIETLARVRVGGIIDRLDEKEGRVRILDYKTSGSAKTYRELEELMTDKDKRASHIFQTYLYSSVLIKSGKFGQAVIPALLYLQDAAKEDYSPVILHEKETITDFNALNGTFEELFKKKIAELLNPTIPFSQTSIPDKCIYCDFKEMCNR